MSIGRNAVVRDRLGALLQRAVPGYARRAKLRAAWGGAGEAREGLFASRAFELMGAASDGPGGDGPCVDDKSWRDLEFPALFDALNTTITPLGGQLLYRQMRSYVFDAQQLSRRYQAYHVLQADGALREKLQLILTALETPSATYIIGALLGPPPIRPKRPWLIYVLGRRERERARGRAGAVADGMDLGRHPGRQCDDHGDHPEESGR